MRVANASVSNQKFNATQDSEINYLDQHSLLTSLEQQSLRQHLVGSHPEACQNHLHIILIPTLGSVSTSHSLSLPCLLIWNHHPKIILVFQNVYLLLIAFNCRNHRCSHASSDSAAHLPAFASTYSSSSAFRETLSFTKTRFC